MTIPLRQVLFTTWLKGHSEGKKENKPGLHGLDLGNMECGMNIDNGGTNVAEKVAVKWIVL